MSSIIKCGSTAASGKHVMFSNEPTQKVDPIYGVNVTHDTWDPLTDRGLSIAKQWTDFHHPNANVYLITPSPSINQHGRYLEAFDDCLKWRQQVTLLLDPITASLEAGCSYEDIDRSAAAAVAADSATSGQLPYPSSVVSAARKTDENFLSFAASKLEGSNKYPQMLVALEDAASNAIVMHTPRKGKKAKAKTIDSGVDFLRIKSYTNGEEGADTDVQAEGAIPVPIEGGLGSLYRLLVQNTAQTTVSGETSDAVEHNISRTYVLDPRNEQALRELHTLTAISHPSLQGTLPMPLQAFEMRRSTQDCGPRDLPVEPKLSSMLAPDDVPELSYETFGTIVSDGDAIDADVEADMSLGHELRAARRAAWARSNHGHDGDEDSSQLAMGTPRAKRDNDELHERINSDSSAILPDDGSRRVGYATVSSDKQSQGPDSFPKEDILMACEALRAMRNSQGIIEQALGVLSRGKMAG